jgi:hypothetical protein
MPGGVCYSIRMSDRRGSPVEASRNVLEARKPPPTQRAQKNRRSFLGFKRFCNSLFRTVCRRARRNSIRLFLLVVLLAMHSNWVSAAADPDCGAPPTVTNERVKGEVEVKANAISRILGALGFGAEYEKSREDIFNKYDDASAARADQYLYFLVCNIVLRSTTMTDQEKFEKIETLLKMKSVMPGSPLGLAL